MALGAEDGLMLEVSFDIMQEKDIEIFAGKLGNERWLYALINRRRKGIIILTLMSEIQ